jgi:hypothetical protein
VRQVGEGSPATNHVIDLGAVFAYFRGVTQQPVDARFLRAAVKTGLRLQQAESGNGEHKKNDGVATLRRIKESLRKRNPKK